MSERFRVSTSDGKYTVIQGEAGGMTFLRHGEPWQAADEAFSGVGMILELAQDLAQLRKDFEIQRKAAKLFEEASHTWQERALKAEAANRNVS